jgi:hypothetical protein
MRAACTGVEHIMRAGDLLGSLSPEALECVRDYCSEYNKDRKGPEHDFKAAWIDIVNAFLIERRKMERDLLTGITGRRST